MTGGALHGPASGRVSALGRLFRPRSLDLLGALPLVLAVTAERPHGNGSLKDG